MAQSKDCLPSNFEKSKEAPDLNMKDQKLASFIGCTHVCVFEISFSDTLGRIGLVSVLNALHSDLTAGNILVSIAGKLCQRNWNIGSQNNLNSNKSSNMLSFLQIYGCATFDFHLASFGIYNYTGYRTMKFTIEASVKERATGISLNATKVTKPVDKTDVKLSFSGTPDIFKPGLPFEAAVGDFFHNSFLSF